jgi:hypothetical protein
MLFRRQSIVAAMAILTIAAPRVNQAQPSLPPKRPSPTLEQDRRRLIEANLALKPEEARQFWPIYDRFAADLAKWREHQRHHIGLFGENYDNLSEDEARQFVEEGLTLEEQRQRLLRDHLKRVGQVLPAYKLALYSQIEFKINAFVEAGIAEHIPLLDETAPPPNQQ